MKFNLEELIECVPNFSEGRNRSVIEKIVASIESTENITLLGVDTGASANRTVVTFVGPPESVFTAAFRAYETASKHIDIAKHTGNHPKVGALDVCPIVPFSDGQMATCIEIAERLAERVGEELAIPVFLYGKSAKSEGRIALPSIRKGGYENLGKRISNEGFIPDYGPKNINARFGATVIGARNILIAYNVNLSSSDLEIARSIAKEIRRSDLARVDGSRIDKTIRAIGWFVEEFDCCQVSMNLTDHRHVSMKQAFDLVRDIASKHSIEVSGSELVGLAPLKSLVPEWDGMEPISNMVHDLEVAIDYLGLNSSYPFKKEEKVIEFKLNSLIDN